MNPEPSTNRLFSARIGLTLLIIIAAFGILPSHLARAATYTVTNTADSGAGSLRQAILNAESNAGADEITFDSGVTGTITLASALPEITEDLTITGPGADVLAVSGNDLYRVFEITGGTITISGLTITHGYPDTEGALGYYGGGLYIASPANVTLRECAITDNTLPSNSSLAGAGIYSDGGLTLTRCTISNNDAADNTGGGLYLFASESSITASTFSGNSADYGGGIYVYNATADINSTTITNNTANADDGGITVDTNGVITLTNSIVAGNIDADAFDYYPDVDEFWGNINSGGYNVIGIDDDAVISGDGATGDQVGTSGSPLDPHLGPLADNSGRTQTHALLAGSPALDAIPEGGNAYNGASATDQRGFPRPLGDNADVGAYEWEPFFIAGVAPARNAVAAALDSSVVVTYTAPVSATTVTSRTVAVHSMMQGLVTATHSVDGEVVTVDPTREFFPGELVYAVATNQTTDITGTHPLTSTQWQFNAAAPAGYGRLGDTPVDAGTDTSSTRSVAWGDFDGDGDLDLAVGNDEGQNAVYPNNGDGSFGTPVDFGSGSDRTRSLTWGDYDNDGDLDLTVGTYFSQTTIYPNNGDGSFGSAVTVGTGNDASYSMVWGDYDEDGDLDLAVGNSYRQNIVYPNNGDGTFGTPVNFGTGSDDTYSVAWGDFDGDGDLDIAAGNYREQNAVYLNDGDGTFPISATLGTGSDWTTSLAWGDFDGDGDLDLTVGNLGGQNAVYPNNGDGSFGTPVNFGTVNDDTMSLAWGDFDGDGDLDIAVGNRYGQNVVYPSNGDGTFGAGVDFGSGSDVTYNLAWGDFDGDGDLDIALGNYDEQNVVYVNEPSSADLSIVKTVSPGSAAPGEAVTYTLTFSNISGLTATGVTLTDSVPVLVTNPTVASSSGAAITLTGSAPNFVWDVADLAPGQGGIITLTGALAEPLAAGVFTNTAQIAYAGAEDDETNNTDKAGLTVQNVAPVADADSDQYVLLNATVTLNGSASSDANGDALTYGWTQTGGPTVTLSDANATSPTFTAPGSETVLTFTLTVTDSLGVADSTPDEVVIMVNEVVNTYLPLLHCNHVVAPDLVVQSITATGDDVQVVVENQGNAPATDEFWVAAYVDPNPAPTAANQLWWDLGTEGMFWGVTEDLLPLNPGGTITLVYNDASYDADHSRVYWPLAAGTPVYVQVDAYNEDTTYGAVRENHEITGATYNNIATTNNVE